VARYDGVAIAVREVFSLVEPAPIIVLNYGVVDPAAFKRRIDRNLRQMTDVFIKAIVLGTHGGSTAGMAI
jgi:hypothetical protein